MTTKNLITDTVFLLAMMAGWLWEFDRGHHPKMMMFGLIGGIFLVSSRLACLVTGVRPSEPGEQEPDSL